MSFDFESYDHTFRRRTLLALGGGLLGLGVLAGRLFHLQIQGHENYRRDAKLNQIDRQILLPKRGAILDAQGARIADSIFEYDLYLHEKYNKLEAGKIQALLGHLHLGEEELSRLLDHVLTDSHRPLLLHRNLNQQQLVRIEYHRPNLPNYRLHRQMRRYYFMGNALSPITGYVGKADLNDSEGRPYALMEEYRLGKAGIERQYDQYLHGHIGEAEIKVNVHGKHLQELDRAESKAGDDLRLHIHAELQEFAMQRLVEHHSGAVVVLDAMTGGIVTLASYPSYDANQFKTTLSAKQWREINDNPFKPLVNKAISGLYAPGSTFKPIVALAALREGISPQTRHLCRGSLSLGNARFHCWKKHGHGNVDMKEALVQSCDVWFYQTAQQLGIDKIAKMAKDLGFGETSGIDLENEKAGLIPDKAWKRTTFDAPFYPGEVIIHGIGQGFTLSTPLQIARAYGSFINGGILHHPKIGDRIVPQDKQADQILLSASSPKLNIPDAHMAFVRGALIDAVNVSHGTAWRSRLPKKTGFGMAGKTGTTQIRRITKAERLTGIRKKNIAWKLRDHALFAGFAPIDHPRFVITVVVEHGVSGSRSAAPIARDVFAKMGEIGLIHPHGVLSGNSG